MKHEKNSLHTKLLIVALLDMNEKQETAGTAERQNRARRPEEGASHRPETLARASAAAAKQWRLHGTSGSMTTDAGGRSEGAAPPNPGRGGAPKLSAAAPWLEEVMVASVSFPFSVHLDLISVR